MSAAAKLSNITIYSIGVGSSVNTDELEFMASEPKEEHVLLLNSFTDLNVFVSKISRGVCLEPQPLPKQDIIKDTVRKGATKFFKSEVTVENAAVAVLFSILQGEILVYGSATQKNPDILSYESMGQVNPSNSSQMLLKLKISLETRRTRRGLQQSATAEVYFSITGKQEDNQFTIEFRDPDFEFEKAESEEEEVTDDDDGGS